MIPGRRPPTLRLLLRGLSVLSAVTVAASAAAQTPAAPDPRAAQPERPTVATHAYTVAPGYVEIEAGAQRQPTEWANADVSVPVLFKIGLGSRLQLDVAPGFARVASDGGVRSGVTDVMLAVKWRLADRAPGPRGVCPATLLRVANGIQRAWDRRRSPGCGRPGDLEPCRRPCGARPQHRVHPNRG